MRRSSLILAGFAIVLMVPGCGLFQKVEKQKDSFQTSEKLDAVISNEFADTSSTYTNRRYFGITPEIQAAYLKSFEMSMNVANSAASAAMLKGNTKDMSAAMNNMSTSTGQLLDLLKNGALGYDESSKSQAGVKSSSAADISQEKESKEEHSSKVKAPDYGALLIGGGILAVLLVIVLIWQNVRISKLSTEIKRHITYL